MTTVHTHRFPFVGLAALCCGIAGAALAWWHRGFPGPDRLDTLALTIGMTAGILLPLGLSVFNVFWKERLYQNLPLLAALVFNLAFDLVFIVLLGIGTLWTLGSLSEVWQIREVLFRFEVLTSLAGLAVLLFLHHFVSMIRTILGPGRLGQFLLGTRKYPRVSERFVLALELQAPPSGSLDRNAPRYLGFLNDFYQDLEDCAAAHGAELTAFTRHGAVLSWPEVPGSANNQAIKLVHDLRGLIGSHETWYLVVYQIVPRFRAALDFGSVTSAELGWHRKEIVTHGSAVEAVGRLLSASVKLKEDFCVGEAAMERLILPAGSRIHRTVSMQAANTDADKARFFALEQIAKN